MSDLICANTSRDEVQSKIDAAIAGDRVLIPSGTVTYSGSPLSWQKRIHLQGGYGGGETVITDSTTGGAASFLIGIGASATDFSRISHLHLVKGVDHNEGMIQVYGDDAIALHETGFKIDHVTIDIGSAGSRGMHIQGIYGLIDRCTFNITASSGSVQSIRNFMGNVTTDFGFEAWKSHPLAWGTEEALYIQNCTFTTVTQEEETIDLLCASAAVIRDNVFVNTNPGGHGTDSGSMRSTRWIELYRNQITNNGAATLRTLTLRGGTAVAFDNTLANGGPGQMVGVNMQCQRATISGYGWGVCNGTHYDFDLTNKVGATADTAYRFRSDAPDTWCNSSGSPCDYYLDGGGSGTRGYPSRDNVGRAPGQILKPVYIFENRKSGVLVDGGFYGGGGTYPGGNDAYPDSTWCAPERDFYNQNTSFLSAPTTGIGVGLLSARPSSGLVAGVGWWATDEQKLYRAVNSTDWELYYQPLGAHSLEDAETPTVRTTRRAKVRRK